jgi:hypothetical protein
MSIGDDSRRPESSATDGKPARSTMSAEEVLSWIAFRDIRGPSDTDPERGFAEQPIWPDMRPTLEALEARIAGYCIYRPIILDGEPWDGRSFESKLFSPKGPHVLRRLCADAGRREGRIVTFAELANDLREKIGRIEANDRKRASATDELLEALRPRVPQTLRRPWYATDNPLEALRARRIAVRAYPRGPDGVPDMGVIPVDVPNKIFLNYNITISGDGSIGPGYIQTQH